MVAASVLRGFARIKTRAPQKALFAYLDRGKAARLPEVIPSGGCHACICARSSHPRGYLEQGREKPCAKIHIVFIIHKSSGYFKSSDQKRRKLSSPLRPDYIRLIFSLNYAMLLVGLLCPCFSSFAALAEFLRERAAHTPGRVQFPRPGYLSGVLSC